LLIFQQTGHLLPLALVVLTITSSVPDCSTIAAEVIHNSEKSILFEISYKFLLKFIVKFASKLDPISLLALLASILMLQISLIFFNSFHFLFNFSFSNDLGNSIFTY
jgi:hypothetical protein